MSDEPNIRAANDSLTCAVDKYLEDMGWDQPGMPVTDLVLVSVRRGFDANGGKSIANCITPTETSMPMILGMVGYAKLWAESLVNESLDSEE